MSKEINLLKEILRSNKYVPHYETSSFENDVEIRYSNSVDHTITSIIESVSHDIKNDINDILKNINKISLKGFYISLHNNIADVLKSRDQFKTLQERLELEENIDMAKKLADLNTNLIGEMIVSKYISLSKSHLVDIKSENINLKIGEEKKKLKLISFFNTILNNSFQAYNDYHNPIKVSRKLSSKKNHRVEKNTRKKKGKIRSRKIKPIIDPLKPFSRVLVQGMAGGHKNLNGGGNFFESFEGVSKELEVFYKLKYLIGNKYERYHDFGKPLNRDTIDNLPPHGVNVSDTCSIYENDIRAMSQVNLGNISSKSKFEPSMLQSLVNTNLGIDELSRGMYYFISKTGTLSTTLERVEIDFNSMKLNMKIIDNLGLKEISEFIENNIVKISRQPLMYQLDGLDGCYIKGWKKQIKNIMAQGDRKLLNIFPKLWDPVSATPKNHNVEDLSNYFFNYCNVFNPDTHRYIYLTYNIYDAGSTSKKWSERISEFFLKKAKPSYLKLYVRSTPLSNTHCFEKGTKAPNKDFFDGDPDSYLKGSPGDWSVDINSGFSIKEVAGMIKKLEDTKKKFSKKHSINFTDWGNAKNKVANFCIQLYHAISRLDPKPSEIDIINIIENILFDLKRSGDWGQAVFSKSNILNRENVSIPLVTNDNLCAMVSILDSNSTLFGTTVSKKSVLGIFSGVKELKEADILKFLDRSLKSTFLKSVMIKQEGATEEPLAFYVNKINSESDVDTGPIIAKLNSLPSRLRTRETVLLPKKFNSDLSGASNPKNYLSLNRTYEDMVFNSFIGSSNKIVSPENADQNSVIIEVHQKGVSGEIEDKTINKGEADQIITIINDILDDFATQSESIIDPKFEGQIAGFINLVKTHYSNIKSIVNPKNFSKVKALMNVIETFYYTESDGIENIQYTMSSITSLLATVSKQFTQFFDRQLGVDYDKIISSINPDRRVKGSAQVAKKPKQIEDAIFSLANELKRENIAKPISIMNIFESFESSLLILDESLLKDKKIRKNVLNNSLINNLTMVMKNKIKRIFPEEIRLLTGETQRSNKLVVRTLIDKIEEWVLKFFSASDRNVNIQIPILDTTLSNLETLDTFYTSIL